MMTKPFDSLDETFNIEKTEEVTDIVEVDDEDIVLAPSNKLEDREDDYQFARGQLHDIIEKMQETLNGAMEVAAQSDHPRAYEVAFNGAKHLSDVVDKLQDLHAKEKKMSEESGSAAGGSVNHGTVNNFIMKGTTEDAMKLIKEAQKEDK